MLAEPWTLRPAWWHAAKRIFEYAGALDEITGELHAGRCWRSALEETDQLRDLASADRLLVEHTAPDSTRWDVEHTWPEVLDAFELVPVLMEAAQRGYIVGPRGAVTTIPLSEYADVVEVETKERADRRQAVA